MKVALVQMNSKVGDIDGNLAKCISYYLNAKQDADLVVFPELALIGYPPEDLLFKEAFLDAAQQALQHFAKQTDEVPAIIGLPSMHDHWGGRPILPYNTAAVCQNGRMVFYYHKEHLPNYGVFDEPRYFTRGSGNDLFEHMGFRIGISICEDMWGVPPVPRRQAEQFEADLLINLSASPFCSLRSEIRETIVSELAGSCKTPMLYCNAVGGQDELVFDGGSFACDLNGFVAARAPQFVEHILTVNLPALDTRQAGEATGIVELPLTPEMETYQALVLGTRDYVTKTGFNQVVIGLSGGVDSALVAAIAVDALGSENVTGVLMPSRFSSPGSSSDARMLANNLGIDTFTIPIEAMHRSFEAALPIFTDGDMGVAGENLQARIRGNLLMAFANKFGWMVLTTGNKSEMAMGYATLYGDMAGGFAVIKDVPKTLVFKLCEQLNVAARYFRIPEPILTKPPSAELRADQKDTDSLPPYEVLDPIIEAYVEEDLSISEMVEYGLDEALVTRVVEAIDRNEYKRRQAPPGVRVTPKAFGKDRRLPIANGWPG